MPADSISLLLQSFKNSTEAGLQEIEQFSHESPLVRMRKEIQEQLEKSEKYRAAILQKVNTFGKLVYILVCAPCDCHVPKLA